MRWETSKRDLGEEPVNHIHLLAPVLVLTRATRHRPKPLFLLLQEFLLFESNLLFPTSEVIGTIFGELQPAVWHVDLLAEHGLLGERGVDVLAWESFGKGWKVR